MGIVNNIMHSEYQINQSEYICFDHQFKIRDIKDK